jgi:hypothetical protein
MKYATIVFIIACWTTNAFLFRFSARRGASKNLVSASAAGIWLALVVATILAMHVQPFSAPAGLYVAGGLGGIALAAVMPLIMGAVARGNLAVSWTLLTLSFAAAALFAIIYPGEHVAVPGVIGLVAAAGAIALLGLDSAATGTNGGFKRGWGFYMSLAFIANTLALYSFTLGTTWGGVTAFGSKMAFFLAETVVFFVAGTALCASRPFEGTRLPAVGIGAAIGIVEFVGNYACLMAMGDASVPGYVFFPATTGGSTLTVAFIAALVCRERPGRRGWLGLALGLVALVLLSWSA